MRATAVLIRREFWEHRALWIAPLVTAALLVATIFGPRIDVLNFGADQTAVTLSGTDPHRLAIFGLIEWGLSVPLYVVMVIVLNFYLLDCLYAERKDRSILFWKSLPVSDAATVISKLLVAIVVVPVGVYLLSIVTNLLFSALWLGRLSMSGTPMAASWNTVVWLKVQALMLLGLVISILWYAPLAAYLLLVSAWARRSVFLWATLPPLLAVWIEKLTFGTHYAMSFCSYRTWGIWGTMDLEGAVRHAETGGSQNLISPSALYDSLPLFQVFGNIDLWFGLLATAALTFAAIRIRRYRDDT